MFHENYFITMVIGSYECPYHYHHFHFMHETILMMYRFMTLVMVIYSGLVIILAQIINVVDIRDNFNLLWL
jgi:hypothetical protein